jgi:hypothetical protein
MLLYFSDKNNSFRAATRQRRADKPRKTVEGNIWEEFDAASLVC